MTPAEEDPVGKLGAPHDVPSNSRYSLLSLLVATTLVAVALFLLRYLSIFGLLIMLLSIVIAEIAMRKRNFAGRFAFSRGLWGLVLPLLCIIYDPGFLHASLLVDWIDGFASPSSSVTLRQLLDDSRGVTRLPPILWQCLGLTLWMLGRTWLAPLAAVFCGFFWVGAVIAAIVGICLLPISLYGLLLVGMGLLGLTPFWTMREYGRAALECRRISLPIDATESQRAWQFAQELVGVVFAIVVPIIFSCWALDVDFQQFCRVLIESRY